MCRIRKYQKLNLCYVPVGVSVRKATPRDARAESVRNRHKLEAVFLHLDLDSRTDDAPAPPDEV